ncbi:SPASM domain-containing protein [Thermogemmatispora carboxidivorans]|uniref:SPASM domain-containing protein n=1 Tax=Thermogemmatispora carboxidivorans TaxID=1382306 RepID=UPI001EE20885|nr:SPASM domain-containing protein [Thermogemmatispora carboxidivorans]
MVTLAESLGVRKVHFGRLFSTGRGEDQQKIAQAHLLRLIDYLEELKMRNPLIGRTPSKSMPCVPSIPSYDGCGGCARGVYAYISYNGGVYPCTNLYKSEWLLGNLREQDFTGIWEHSPVLADLRTRLSTVSTSMGEAFHD